MGSSFSEHQLIEITKTLDEQCQGEVCISRKALYLLVKDELCPDLELYLFEQAITDALHADKLPGFESRRGRSGGICKKGAFVNKDRVRRHKSPPGCSIVVGNDSYYVKVTYAQATRFITQVLKGQPTIPPGDLSINSTSFRIPKTIEAKQALVSHLETLKAQRTNNSSSE